MPLRVMVNGNPRQFDGLRDAASLTELVAAMSLKPDRVAIELNGQIVTRSTWPEVKVGSGDKLEIVHFVGGGSASVDSPA